MYLAVKEMAKIADDVIIVTSRSVDGGAFYMEYMSTMDHYKKAGYELVFSTLVVVAYKYH